MISRLIGRVQLLVALSEDIPVEVKLDVQPMLKMLEDAVHRAVDDPDSRSLAARHYRALRADLAGDDNLRALLDAMRVFAPYLE